MSYIFLLEQGEESSAECFSDIPASVLSNGISTPANASSPDNGTDACHASLSGTTCKPLTANLGAGASMSSAGAFRAKTSAQPERAQESTANALECGTTWLELWARYDRASSSWKTHQCLWEEVLPWSSVILPKWGMMQNGVLWERTTSAVCTNETEHGFWPTPLKSDGYLSTYPQKSFSRQHSIASLPEYVSRLFGMRISPTTSERLMGWPDGWTDLSAAATDKFRQWRLSHSKSFPHVLANIADEGRR